ncbi:MAG: hypothetical protein NW207_01485 [Cytophagales bacterium]|nr:hypothetical protein [Cytophagales bacterium]
MNYAKLFFILYFHVFFCAISFSQGTTTSPYAQFGIGDMEPIGNARNVALGFGGSALASTHYINVLNPAFTAYNRTFVAFECGLYVQQKRVTNDIASANSVGVNMQYLNLLLPLSSKNWTVTIGLRPYTNANARYRSISLLENNDSFVGYDTVSIQNINQGGLNTAFMSHAFRLPQGFCLGISTGYVLGNIQKEQLYTLQRDNQQTLTQLILYQNYTQLDVQLSLGYYKQINDKYALSMGASGSNAFDMNSTQVMENKVLDRSGYENRGFGKVYSDSTDNNKKSIKLPSVYRFGVNIDKLNKASISIDYQYTDWSVYQGFETVSEFSGSHRYSAGVEYTPSYNSIKVINRIKYRFGAYFHETPFKTAQKVYDIGASVGFGMPLGNKMLYSVNFSVTYGSRGSVVNESYTRFCLNFTINDKWFVRYRLD